MNALESARAVLASAPSSKGSSEPSSVGGQDVTLIEVWCEALQGVDCPSEHKEVVVRALQCSKFGERHDRIVLVVLPLLLDPQPNLRLQAAKCALQYLSTAPAAVHRAVLATTVETVSRALAPLPHTLPSASSALYRFASTSLRIINTLTLKVHPLPQDTVATLATLAASWVYYGSAPVGATSPTAPVRGRAPPQTQPLFGVMSAFMQPTSTPTRRRKDSTASVASTRASSAGRDGAASESSEDEGKRVDRRRDTAQIRLDALTCLRSLALSNPRSIHRHWHLFLADSPYLRNRSTLLSLVEHDPSCSVRLQACATLAALLQDSAPYLALAEDRSTTSSFTSLSTKVGEIVAELHLSLSSLLAIPPSPDREELHLALLALACQLAANSPYGRMKRALARQLAQAILPSLNVTGTTVVVATASALASVAARLVATTSQQSFDWGELVFSAVSLVSEARPDNVRAAGWTLLAAVVPASPTRDWSTEIARLSITNSTSPALAEGQTAFLVALARRPASSPAFSATIPLLISHALASPHAPVRALACAALPGPALGASRTTNFSPWRAALAHASDDPSLVVQRAACRALGLLAKSEHAMPAREEGEARTELVDAVTVLLQAVRRASGCGVNFSERAEQQDVGEVTWALANCCDALEGGDLDGDAAVEVLRTTLDLLAGRSGGEQAHVSVFRILAWVSKAARPLDAAMSTDTAAAVQAGIAHLAAKVRWNAASAASALLVHQHLPTAAFLPLVAALLSALLQDASYKVRIHACGALLAAVHRRSTLPSEMGGTVQDALRLVQLKVEAGEVSLKEQTHAQTLIMRMKTLSAQLSAKVYT